MPRKLATPASYRPGHDRPGPGRPVGVKSLPGLKRKPRLQSIQGKALLDEADEYIKGFKRLTNMLMALPPRDRDKFMRWAAEKIDKDNLPGAVPSKQVLAESLIGRARWLKRAQERVDAGQAPHLEMRALDYGLGKPAEQLAVSGSINHTHRATVIQSKLDALRARMLSNGSPIPSDNVIVLPEGR